VRYVAGAHVRPADSGELGESVARYHRHTLCTCPVRESSLNAGMSFRRDCAG
jgi:hypothetical protein